MSYFGSHSVPVLIHFFTLSLLVYPILLLIITFAHVVKIDIICRYDWARWQLSIVYTYKPITFVKATLNVKVIVTRQAIQFMMQTVLVASTKTHYGVIN